MRQFLVIVLVVVLGAGAWYQFSYLPKERAAEAAAVEKAAADAAAAEAEKAAADAKAAEDKAAADAKAAADQAAADAKAAAAAAGAAATDGTAAAGDARGMIWDATKLSEAEITARIAAAPVAQSVRDTLMASYTGLKDNPAAVQQVLDQLKQAMGL